MLNLAVQAAMKDLLNELFSLWFVLARLTSHSAISNKLSYQSQDFKNQKATICKLSVVFCSSNVPLLLL